MKRMVRASFGLRDESWVEPPEDYWDVEVGVVEFDIPESVVRTYPEEYIVMEEDLEPVLEKTIGDEDVYDESTGIEVCNADTAKDEFVEAFDREVEGKIDPNSKYRISGTFTVTYEYEVYRGPYSSNSYDETGPRMTEEYPSYSIDLNIELIG